jgi:putative Mn2+ efflux pump MntP
MSWFATIWIAVALAMDAFAVSTAVSASGRGAGVGGAFRLSFNFGLFQFIMPIAGWLLGYTVSRYIQSIDHWVAFGLLGLIGGRMIIGTFNSASHNFRNGDPTRGWPLLMLSVATSIDALAVGLSLALLDIAIWLPCAVIGVVAATMTLVGAVFGRILGTCFGKRMEFAGGVILIGIGTKILVEHLGLA